MRTILFLILFMLPLPALGHSADDLDAWRADWFERVEAEPALTVELVTEYQEFMSRHAVIVLPAERRAAAPQAPEYIEALLVSYFQPEDLAWARRVSFCESRWDANAKNPRSSASGLFQHLATYWDSRSESAGWAGADIFDPEANVAVAAWLFYHGGGPSHWVCK